MDIRRLALYPCLIQTDAAIGEISHVKGGGRHEDAPYFFCRDQLRTQNQVNVKIFLEIFGGFLKEFRVADAGNRVRDSIFFASMEARIFTSSISVTATKQMHPVYRDPV